MFFCTLLAALLLIAPALALPQPSDEGTLAARAPNPCTAPSTANTNVSALNNPFIFNDGTPVQTAADWTCRHQQIAALILGYEGGTLPGTPQSVAATFSKNGNSGSLAITVKDNNTQITFTPTITFPSGNPPTGGWPLVIAVGGASLPIPSNIAVLNFDNSGMAEQDSTASRGQGLRIIDALEITPSANINTQKLAVTGCSRDGKGALWIGAFEERIALTIPQESGSGGDTCWRLSHYEKDSGSVVQDATEIVTEKVWFSTNFNNYVNELNVLPYDHHLLAALIAPRAMISYENADYVWLSPLSSFGCMTAAHTVWQALGVANNHGFVQVGGHSHCAWPANSD
ncbi:hypothetical protein EUX98_g4398 [Antrodiella citrinella]|uniref:(4-O-methyl)-D-glucuronate--lignin esterase n=1 Tax=Antrodiella citrinella TaxID=2447956 RepID=A0A4S4MV37_9APHY|nr:hypothetical protein EUX98_g4398 [Antrodiella citrinella]